MKKRNETRNHNISVITNLGFQRVKNTTVFEKENKYILSPAVSENSSGEYWFDIREKNLNRINKEALLFVRIVPNLFIIEYLKKLSFLLSKELMDNRPNSGNVWGIHIKFKKESREAFLYKNKKDYKDKKKYKIPTQLLNKEEVIIAYKKINNGNI